MSPEPVGHVESAENHYASAIDHLHVLGLGGVSILACDYGSAAASWQLDPVDATIVDLQIEPPRMHRWSAGGVWNELRPRRAFHFFTPARRPYSSESLGSARNIEVGLPVAWCRRVFEEAGLGTDPELGALETSFGHDPWLNDVMLRLARVSRYPNSADALLADYLVYALTLYLGRKVCPQKPMRTPKSTISYRQTRLLREYVLSNLDRPITLRELASRLSLSPVYFAEVFKASRGTSPHQWVLQMRMERAGELLRHRDLPLEHIADTCGFANPSSFGKAFRRVMGCTPGAYRARVNGRMEH